MTEERWQRADNWFSTDFEGGLVMLEIDLGTYIGLNDTAAAVWEAIDTPSTREEIVGYVRARFDVPADTCSLAVSATLDKFRAAGLANAH